MNSLQNPRTEMERRTARQLWLLAFTTPAVILLLAIWFFVLAPVSR